MYLYNFIIANFPWSVFILAFSRHLMAEMQNESIVFHNSSLDRLYILRKWFTYSIDL